MGQCKDCRFWKRQGPPNAGLFGECDFESIPNEPMVAYVFAGVGGSTISVYAGLLMHNEHGCKQFEAKGATDAN